MNYRQHEHPVRGVSRSRRRFVLGVASAGVCAAAAEFSWAYTSRQNEMSVLQGNRFDLQTGYTKVNFTGTERLATTVNGGLPAPVLRWKEGEQVTLRLTNRLVEDSSIHWHGILLPTEMDGVPGMSFAGVRPGEVFEYRFRVNQSGTYWYHSHSGFQEQTGMYGAIVIDPKGADRFSCDRDYVVILSDWTDENPHQVYAKLKKLSHYYNLNERTVFDWWRDVRQKGLAQTRQDRAMWNQMRMRDSDISDVTGATYTFLMNGHAPADGWTALFKCGEKIRLRFINAAAMTLFDLRIPELKMTVIAADGQYVDPVSVDEFRIGVAETYDVIVEPESDIAYTVFAQAIDRSGYARGTLTSDSGLQAMVPPLDPPPVLNHGDMGMAHGGHGTHGGHQNPRKHVAMAEVRGGHGGHKGYGGHRNHHRRAEIPVYRADIKPGPQIDMRADAPRYRLDDPGVGLRGNGRRVLTYADLRRLHETSDPREPEREIELRLTGNMERYMWSFDGIKFADAEPLCFRYGERLRITLVNDTMMNHPIHLHGMWSELETGDEDYLPRKHTVIVPPGSKISYRVTADAYGRWAYHCHLLYHMLGMFREVRVA